jgi:SPP1 gp7 family putative phage head morphogenesis protein
LIVDLLDRYLKLPDAATLGEMTAALVNFANVTRFFETASESIASRMATQMKVENARSWKAAARAGSRGREILSALREELEAGNVGARVREIVRENASLISSIPEEIRERISAEISDLEERGRRPEEIAEFLRERVPELTRSRAALIARTETSKSATALTRARSEDLGLDWYEWATSEDARVRPAHRLMDKVLVNWTDPPAPERLARIKSTLGHYHAGNCPNCRCDSYPVLNIDDLKWPHKVYWRGTIRMYTRSKFAALSGRVGASLEVVNA